jgi:hypothetical protein
MHMLLTSLEATLHGRIPILSHNQQHANQLSRLHLYYIVTGEVTRWSIDLMKHLSDPTLHPDPESEPHQYSSGGTPIHTPINHQHILPGSSIQTHIPATRAIINTTKPLPSNTTHKPKPPTHPLPKKPTTIPYTQTTYTHLIHALNNTDKHIKTLIHNLPELWTTTNARESTITKGDLTPCTWGEHSDTDSIQAFQRAITTRYPPTHSGIIQYTTYIKFTLTND